MRTHTAFRTFRAEKSCGSRWVSLVAAVGLVAALAAPAMADLAVDASGNVTDWGITPFTHSNVTNALLGNMVYTIADDYAPIDYPSGVGHVPSPGGSLGGAHDAGIEGIGEVGHREPDELAAATLQIARDERGLVAQLGNRAQHPRPQLRAHIGGIIDHRRDRCRRHARGLGDVFDCCHERT